METAYIYLWSVFVKWWWLVTAILFGIDKMLEWFWPRYRTRLNERFPLEQRRRFFWGVILTFVFLSGFLAWRDEHLALIQAQKQLTVAGGKKEDFQVQVAEYLRKKAEPYAIPKEEEAAFVQALASSGKYIVDLHCISGETPPFLFAEVLRRLMIQAGWSVDEIRGLPQLESGVSVFTSEKNVPAGVFQLLKLLEKYHVDVQLSQGHDESPTGKFSIFVGRRPQF